MTTFPTEAVALSLANGLKADNVWDCGSVDKTRAKEAAGTLPSSPPVPGASGSELNKGEKSKGP